MGLGSTAKKVQRLSTLAEKLYEQVNEVLERLSDLHDRVEGASEDVAAVRREQREQRAILEALADEQGIDVEAVVDEVEDVTSAAETVGDDAGESPAAKKPADEGASEPPADAS